MTRRAMLAAWVMPNAPREEQVLLEEMNEFARKYNEFAREYQQGRFDLRMWQRAKRAAQKLWGCK